MQHNNTNKTKNSSKHCRDHSTISSNNDRFNSSLNFTNKTNRTMLLIDNSNSNKYANDKSSNHDSKRSNYGLSRDAGLGLGLKS